MTAPISADLLDFFFPADQSALSIAPRGAALDQLCKPWSIQDIYDAGEAAMMRLFERGHRKAIRSLMAQLDDHRQLERVESRHREEFYERRLGAPLSDLHIAIVNNDVDQAAALFGAQDGQQNALLLAAIEGSAALIDALIGAGASAQSTDRHGMTAAHIAAASGNFAGLKALLSRGASPEAVDHQGATPLMLAVGSMSTSCAELLLPLSDRAQTDKTGRQAKDYAPAFHVDVDDSGYDEALRFSQLIQSLEEASGLDAACGRAFPAKSRSL